MGKILKWTFKTCKEEALKYNTRKDFKKGSGGAYCYAVRNKCINDVCNHMIRFLKPKGYWTKDICFEIASKYNYAVDFYNENKDAYAASLRGGWLSEITDTFDKKCSNQLRYIYAYEFIDNHVYIGLTYNLEERDSNHKKEGTVFNYSEETGLISEMKKLISVPVKPEEASKLEEFYIEKYKERGWKILNKNKPGGLGGVTRKWTKHKCKEVAINYSSKSAFIKNEPKAYDACNRNRWTNEVCEHMDIIKKPNGYYSLEMCITLVKTCITRKEFKEKYSSAHTIVYRNKWKDIVFKYLKNNV